jgi:hypothetical protein
MINFLEGFVGALIGAGMMFSVVLLFGNRDRYVWICVDPEEEMKIKKFIAVMNTEEKKVYTDIHTIQEKVSSDNYSYASDLIVKSQAELDSMEGMHFIHEYLAELEGREDVPDWVTDRNWDRLLVEEVPLQRRFG